MARSRLVQFLVLGGLLFLAAPGAPDERGVHLDGSRIELHGQREAARRGLPRPTRALLDEVSSRAIEDAVLLREAHRLGLDQDDAIIRGRLIQKMLFIGNRSDPALAYQFARDGAALTINAGAGVRQTVTIDEPLDFTVVTDHSEFLALTARCQFDAPGNEDVCDTLADTGSARSQAQLVALLARMAQEQLTPLPGCDGTGAEQCEIGARSVWQANQEAARAADVPCEFSALIGYEWTATTGGANLHRNVVFASESVPDDAYDYMRYPTIRELWRALDQGCLEADGCDAITIPHNSNASQGQMWDTADDPELAEYMTRYQGLVEIYQHKGASECRPGDALADPACGFEISDNEPPATSAPGYVRNALARGLAMQEELGVNPLALGFIASTDTHNATPGAVAEQGWKGHLADNDDTPADRLALPAFSPGGIAAVWASENTRAEIFAALERRETYATSGPRIVVRAYALAGVADDAAAQALCDDPAFPEALIDAGAQPMGGELPATGSPYFFVSAMAADEPLDSFDLVRLRAGDGEPSVSIHSQTLGEGEQGAFCAFWRDAEFEPARAAAYYARVYQQPTARWSAADCARAPDEPACTDEGVPTVIRERAWTSPIFLVPARDRSAAPAPR
jgi:hypothetical protein